MVGRVLGFLHGLLLLRLGLASPFCAQELPELHGNAKDVEVIYVQAELEWEAVSKWPGRLLGAYHTALVLAQGDKFWTVEFRALDFPHAIFPEFHNDTGGAMDWSKAGVGFCFTGGILHGRQHWSVWKTVARVGADDVEALTKQFMQPWLVNSPWSYQLFKVVGQDGSESLGDLTCSQGVLSILDYLQKSRGVQFEGVSGAAELKQTTVALYADKIEKVNTASNSEMREVRTFYEAAVALNATGIQKVLDIFRTVEGQKFIRVSNGDGEAYYRLYLRSPYITSHYGARADWKGSFPNSTATHLAAAAESSELVVV